MMAGAAYLADTSVYVVQARSEDAFRRFQSLLAEGRLAVCQMAALEYLNNAPDPQSYERLWGAVHGQRWQDVTTEAMDRALDVHHQLSAKSQHRQFSLPDLVIAATAELSGLTVLHYDEDYDRIAKVTGQPVEWIVPRGSL
jgi:predicted nucleic acid-binding protein